MNQRSPHTDTPLSNSTRSARFRALLPWVQPERQAVTTGWWGLFPNIPRNLFGRVCWIIVVGGVSLGSGALSVMLLIGLFMQHLTALEIWSGVFGVVALFATCLVFAWHTLNGIALALREDLRRRELHEELASAKRRVELARQRLNRHSR